MTLLRWSKPRCTSCSARSVCVVVLLLNATLRTALIASLSGALSQRHSPTLQSPLLKHDLIDADLASLVIKDGCAGDGFLGRYSSAFSTTGIKLVIPMAVRGELTGFVFLGSKASGEEFTDEDFQTIKAMARHIGVGIHTHRLLEQVANRAEENRRLYEELRAIYRDTVRAFAAAIDIKDKYTQGHSERVGKYSEIIARELGWSEREVEERSQAIFTISANSWSIATSSTLLITSMPSNRVS